MKKTLRLLRLIALFGCMLTPSLEAQSYSGGSGTSGDPYLIATKADLKYFSDNNSEWGYYFKQTADISFVPSDFESGGDFYNGGAGFNTIGVQFGTYFTGQYDGNGHTITGMKQNTTDQFNGMFGIVNSAIDPSITGLGLVALDMTASGAYLGGLVAYLNDGSVTDCYTTGTVRNSNSHSGGLVGATNSGTSISTSYSSCTVTGVGGGGTNTAGGFAGQVGAGSTFSNCYASGSVGSATSTNIGGFTGMVSGTMTNCYSVAVVNGTGNIGGVSGLGAGSPTVNNCFWDTEASGISIAGAGTGKTTAEMKTQSTFTNAGWDFSGTWEMIGSNYPRLLTNPDQALPVELIAFTVVVAGNNTELKWTTAAEVNNYGFAVERKELKHRIIASWDRSTDESMHQWKAISFIEGHGTTNTPSEYSFLDKDLKEKIYVYRLKQVDRDGSFSYSPSIEVTITAAPTECALEQNYPNPFNPSTTIVFTLKEPGMTTLKVYDIAGREVAALVNEELGAGVFHQKTFDASHLAGGIYVARLTSGGTSLVRKMMLMK
jgi:hypothetical protein